MQAFNPDTFQQRIFISFSAIGGMENVSGIVVFVGAFGGTTGVSSIFVFLDDEASEEFARFDMTDDDLIILTSEAASLIT